MAIYPNRTAGPMLITKFRVYFTETIYILPLCGLVRPSAGPCAGLVPGLIGLVLAVCWPCAEAAQKLPKSHPKVALKSPKSVPKVAQTYPKSDPKAVQKCFKSVPKVTQKCPKSCPKVSHKFSKSCQKVSKQWPKRRPCRAPCACLVRIFPCYILFFHKVFYVYRFIINNITFMIFYIIYEISKILG